MCSSSFVVFALNVLAICFCRVRRVLNCPTSFMFQMLLCSILVEILDFSEIQLMCDGRTDARTNGRTNGRTIGRTDQTTDRPTKNTSKKGERREKWNANEFWSPFEIPCWVWQCKSLCRRLAYFAECRCAEILNLSPCLPNLCAAG